MDKYITVVLILIPVSLLVFVVVDTIHQTLYNKREAAHWATFCKQLEKDLNDEIQQSNDSSPESDEG